MEDAEDAEDGEAGEEGEQLEDGEAVGGCPCSCTSWSMHTSWSMQMDAYKLEHAPLVASA